MSKNESKTTQRTHTITWDDQTNTIILTLAHFSECKA